MLDFPRWKTIGISIILLLGILFAIPSFLPEKTFDKLPSIAQIKVNLGLDLAGGHRHLFRDILRGGQGRHQLGIHHHHRQRLRFHEHHR